MNSFQTYYSNQAGNGIAGFSGVRYQKGYGFFGRLLNSAVIPFIKFLGKNALSAGMNVANDLMETNDFSMKNIKDVGKQRLGEQAKTMVKDGANKILYGDGVKRRRHRRKKQQKSIKVKQLKRKTKKTRRTKRKSIKAKDFLSL